jgi:hypothetical protein
MSTEQRLAVPLVEQLRAIRPSRDGALAYYPCRVQLHDGGTRERVYLVDADAYARTWGLIPDRRVLVAADVATLEEHPARLPAAFADELYAAGESGMGYCVFTLRFRDGCEQAYLTGNAVDFLPYPHGRGPADVVAATPHRGRDAASRLEGLSYEWCPVAGLDTSRPWWRFWAGGAAT